MGAGFWLHLQLFHVLLDGKLGTHPYTVSVPKVGFDFGIVTPHTASQCPACPSLEMLTLNVFLHVP